MWTDTGTKEQQWSIGSLTGSDTKILTALNTAYGLNIWRGSTNYNNCDIYPTAGNDKDSTIVISFLNNSNFSIKIKNYNLYLTATGTANGANVNWQAWNGSSG